MAFADFTVKTATVGVDPIPNPEGIRPIALGEDEVAVLDCKDCPSGNGNLVVRDLFTRSGEQPSNFSGSIGFETDSRMAMGDLDGDGNDEIAYIRMDTSGHYSIDVFDSGGETIGGFGFSFTLGTPLDIAVGDFNNDTRGDIAVLWYGAAGESGTKYLDVWKGTGERITSTSLSLSSSWGVRRISAGDMDGDHWDDIIFSADHYREFTDDPFTVGFVSLNGSPPVVISRNGEPFKIHDVAGLRDTTSGRAKIVLLGELRDARVFVYSGGSLVEDFDQYIPDVTDGSYPGWVARAITGGDLTGDGYDELFTLAFPADSLNYKTKVFVYSLAPPTGIIASWDTGLTMSDTSPSRADIAAGDVHGEGFFMSPTGEKKTTPIDAVIAARIGAPPHVRDLYTPGQGHYGETWQTTFDSTTTSRESSGVAFSAQIGLSDLVALELRVEFTWTHSESQIQELYTSTEFHAGSVQGSDSDPNNRPSDTLLVVRETYDMFRYRVWNRDMNGDNTIDSRDTVWISTRATKTFGNPALDVWNYGNDTATGIPWRNYPSWTPIPDGIQGRHRVGEPATYQVVHANICEDPDTHMNGPSWIPPNSNEPCGWFWLIPDNGDQGLNFVRGASNGFEIADSYDVNVDGGIRTAAGGITFSKGLGWDTVQRFVAGTSLTLGAESATVPYNCARWVGCTPTEYRFWFVPYFYYENRTASNDPNVQQRFLVLDYLVMNLGPGYTSISPVGDITSPTNGQSFDPGPIPIDGKATTTSNVTNTFKSFTLEWGVGSNPSVWNPIQCESSCTNPRNSSARLGTWDATGKYGGTYTIRLTVRDWANHVVEIRRQVTITGPPPPGLTVTISPSSQTVIYSLDGSCPLDPTASFSASVSGGTGVYTYSWQFGDGGTGTGNPTSHTYPNSGATYTVTLTVTDSAGATGTATATVTVTGVRFC